MARTRDIALLACRAVLGGYLAAHGAQKLFGYFGGHGIETTAAGFHRLGLRPGKVTATALVIAAAATGAAANIAMLLRAAPESASVGEDGETALTE